MTTATIVESEIDEALDELESFIDNSDGWGLRDEFNSAYDEYYEPTETLLLPLLRGYEGDEVWEIFDESPNDEQVARFNKVRQALDNKVAPVQLTVGFNWVKDLPAGEAREACLQMMRDFLAKY
jgi:hypothetical protein